MIRESCIVISSYKDLDVWQKAMQLADKVYDTTSDFPSDERFGLTQQIRRSAVSIPSNIAEGSGRSGTGELLQFLSIARGSLAELETQLILAHRRKFVSNESKDLLLGLCVDVNKMIVRLQQSLRQKRAS